MPHSPTDSTSTNSTKLSTDTNRHPKSWPSTTSPRSVSSTSSLSSLSSTASSDKASLLDHTPRSKKPGQYPTTQPPTVKTKHEEGQDRRKKGLKRQCIDFDWSYKNVCASSSAAAAGGRKAVSGSALGARGGCGMM